MLIRCYGARGSIPVSGEGYVRYGGDSTCLEIRTRNDEIIIVDAGTGIRRLGNRLLGEQRYEYRIIFTHSHMDHIIGFPFFKPIYDERTTIHMMGCPVTQGNMKKLLTRAMAAPLFPVPFDSLKAAIHYSGECSIHFDIDSIRISPINLSHPNLGMGYKFEENGKSFVFLTDNELGYRHRDGRTFDDYAAFAEGADLLIHDAEYTPEEYRTTRTWGHSTYRDALNLALKAGVKAFALCHHNQDRLDDEMDLLVERCRETIEREQSQMACFALTQTFELTL
jgi:phosphoribosyl 1,2-cyclic phosphodiesterase